MIPRLKEGAKRGNSHRRVLVRCIYVEKISCTVFFFSDILDVVLVRGCFVTNVLLLSFGSAAQRSLLPLFHIAKNQWFSSLSCKGVIKQMMLIAFCNCARTRDYKV